MEKEENILQLCDLQGTDRPKKIIKRNTTGRKKKKNNNTGHINRSNNAMKITSKRSKQNKSTRMTMTTSKEPLPER